MTISLQKGGNVSLSKQVPGLNRVRFGLGWDLRKTDGADFDLDASAFLLNADGQVLSNQHFIYYNNPIDPSGAVAHQGDNRTGEGDGDDEVIDIDLGKLPVATARIVFVVTIYEADARKQTFGQVNHAYIRVLDAKGGDREIARHDLSEDASTETAMLFGELHRRNEEWTFKAIGQGYAGGLAMVARDFGVNLG